MWWLRILGALIATAVAFLGYVALLPSVETIARSATIPAPPSVVFSHINDFRKWQAWSPWAKIDPDAKASFEGPQSGEGAVFSWSGNAEIGAGRMTIIESRPDDHVKIRIDFTRPFEGTSTAYLRLKAEGSGTNVTWAMTGERPYLYRMMGVLFNAEEMIGDQFEKGLSNLAATVKERAI